MAEITAKTIIYVARDLERALGKQTISPSFFIITNSTPFAKAIAQTRQDILLVDSTELLDTPELLKKPEVISFINQQSNPHIVVFKNLPLIEKICAEQNWPLLNPSATLAQTIEEKISQVAWLGDLAKFLPPHHITTLKDTKFAGEPFIIQFNRAHTGTGTMLISHQTQLDDLQTKFPDRPVRITAYIKGTMITSNNVVFQDTIVVGTPNVQITGLAPFTDQPFATIGNDWSLANQILSSEQKNSYQLIVTAIGEKLRASGWKGLFGTDIMLAESGELFLIEINARQPASTTYESTLQNLEDTGLTTFSLHLLSLQDEKIAHQKPGTVTHGAQIILRNQATPFSETCLTIFCERLKTAGFITTRYQNTEPGSDLVRIQSSHGLMETPTKLNERGESIVQALQCSI